MTNLNKANIGMNRYCGPAVLSILTGKSTDECASVISRINKQYPVQTVELTDLLKAADKMGFDCIPASIGSTLYGTIVRLAMESDGMYIITIPNHFVCVEIVKRKAYFCDNHTREAIPAASSARLGQPVLFANKVTRRIEPEPLSEPSKKHIFYIDAVVTTPVKIQVIAIDEDDAFSRAMDGAWHGCDPFPKQWDKAKVNSIQFVAKGPGIN